MIFLGLSFSERIALRTIRGLLNGIIGRFTPEELQHYIDHNGSLWGDTSDGMKHLIHTTKNQFYTYYRKYFSQITTETLIEWLKEDQPKLHAVILSSQRNHTWFDQQWNTFKKKIEES